MTWKLIILLSLTMLLFSEKIIISNRCMWFRAQFTQKILDGFYYLCYLQMFHNRLLKIKMQNNKHDISVRKLPHSTSAVYCLRNGNSGSFDSLINYDTTTKTDILELKTTHFSIGTKNKHCNQYVNNFGARNFY